MQQDLFTIPGLNIPVHSYGLMMVIGFLAAVQLAKFLARRSRLDPEIFVNAALIALVSGVIGARLSHVLENLPQYTNPARTFGANLWDAVNMSTGGLTFYGGFLVAFPILVWYAIWKKVPLRLGMDIVAPCVMVGLAFGRFGCFMNGCCYGAQCDLPWAVHFPPGSPPFVDQVHDGIISSLATYSAGVHPAQLYSAFNAFLIAAVLLAYFTIPHIPGRAFAWMLILKGVSRFLLEMIRTEPAVLGPMSFSMVVSLVLIVLGIVMWFIFGRIAAARGEIGARPVSVSSPAPAARAFG